MPRFEPESDYRSTLDAFQSAFGDHGGKAVVGPDGSRLLAGNLSLTGATTALRDAETINLIVVEHPGMEGEGPYSYSFTAQHHLKNGDELGDPVTGVYFRQYVQHNTKDFTARENERMRAWLELTQFNALEAMFAASDHLAFGSGSQNLLVAEQTNEHLVALSRRRQQVARFLGYLDPRRWLGRRGNADGQNGPAGGPAQSDGPEGKFGDHDPGA